MAGRKLRSARQQPEKPGEPVYALLQALIALRTLETTTGAVQPLTRSSSYNYPTQPESKRAHGRHTSAPRSPGAMPCLVLLYLPTHPPEKSDG